MGAKSTVWLPCELLELKVPFMVLCLDLQRTIFHKGTFRYLRTFFP